MSGDMTERAHETDDVVLAFDPQQIDDTGYAWAYRSQATRPELVVAGAVLIGGDRHNLRPVRIVDVIERADGDALVHIDELRTPQQLADQLERNRKSAAVMLIDKVLELDEAGELDGVFQRHVEFARDLDRYRRLTGKIEAARQAADNEEDA